MTWDPAVDVTPAPLQRYQSFRVRLAGTSIDTTLITEVPHWLKPPLRTWLALAAEHDPDAPRRVALRLTLSPREDGPGRYNYLQVLQELDTSPDLLDAVHAMLEVHRGPSRVTTVEHRHAGENYLRLIEQLRTDLEDAGSAYTVAPNNRELITRVDPTVTAATQEAIGADPTAGELLADAWRHAYGRDPDPDAAYDDAVRAVEQAACPKVLPNEPGSATLDKVIRHLQQGGHKWQFVLLGTDGNPTVDAITALTDRLWVGQVGRHRGDNTRAHTLEEARAAVHAAAFLVQMYTGGAVTRRPS